MSLSRIFSDTKSFSDTHESSTLGNTDDVDEVSGLEDVGNSDFLFEVVDSPLDFGVDVASVNLDFEERSLVDAEAEVSHLGVDEDSDD